MTSFNQNLAIVFPGQGSQSVGMLAALALEDDIIRKTFDQASDVLGYDCWDLAQNGPAEKLNRTEYTQPVLLTASVAVWRFLNTRLDVGEPAYVAGHSLGEYSALVAAKALKFEHAVQLVSDRARAMQAAVPLGQGASVAVLGLDDEIIESVCASIGEENNMVVPINFNAPGQTVVAGHSEAVKMASEALSSAGAKRIIPLNVSIPSHCELMRPAAQQFEQSLLETRFETPKYKVIHNADLKVHEDPNSIRQVLKQQLYLPVPWVATIRQMAAYGIQQIIECGPGKVLTGLGKRIDRNLVHTATDTPQSVAQIEC